MFTRLFSANKADSSQPERAPLFSNGSSSTSDAEELTEEISEDQVPPLTTRRHTFSHPYHESVLLDDSMLNDSSFNQSFDPFDAQHSLKRSKSFAVFTEKEEITNHRAKVSSNKIVHFNTSLIDSNNSRNCSAESKMGTEEESLGKVSHILHSEEPKSPTRRESGNFEPVVTNSVNDLRLVLESESTHDKDDEMLSGSETFATTKSFHSTASKKPIVRLNLSKINELFPTELECTLLKAPESPTFLGSDLSENFENESLEGLFESSKNGSQGGECDPQVTATLTKVLDNSLGIEDLDLENNLPLSSLVREISCQIYLYWKNDKENKGDLLEYLGKRVNIQNDLEKENRLLKSEIKLTAEKLATEKEITTSLQHSNQKLQEELDGEISAVNEMKNELKEFEKENDNQLLVISQLNQRMKNFEMKEEENEVQLAQLNEIVTVYKKSFEINKTLSNEELSHHIQNIKEKETASIIQIQELKSEIEKLKVELKKSNDSLTSSESETRKLLNSVKSLKEKELLTDNLRTKVIFLQDSNSSKTLQIKDLETENTNLKEELKDQIEKNKAVLDKIKVSEDNNKAYTEELEKLKAQQIILENQLQEDRMNSLQEKELYYKFEKLISKSIFTNNKVIEDLKYEIKELKENNASINLKLTETMKEKDEKNIQLKRMTQMIEESDEALKKNLDIFNKEIESLEKDFKNSQQLICKLEAENDQKNKTLQKREQEFTEYQQNSDSSLKKITLEKTYFEISNDILSYSFKRLVKDIFECLHPVLTEKPIEDFSLRYYEFIKITAFDTNDSQLISAITNFLGNCLKQILSQYKEVEQRLVFEVEDKQRYFESLLEKYTTLVLDLQKIGRKKHPNKKSLK